MVSNERKILFHLVRFRVERRFVLPVTDIKRPTRCDRKTNFLTKRAGHGWPFDAALSWYGRNLKQRGARFCIMFTGFHSLQPSPRVKSPGVEVTDCSLCFLPPWSAFSKGVPRLLKPTGTCTMIGHRTDATRRVSTSAYFFIFFSFCFIYTCT